MKHAISFTTAIILSLLFFQSIAFAQEPEQMNVSEVKKHMIVKQNGAKFIGEILTEDAREILLLTDNLGEIIIPKHEIKEIRELQSNLAKDYLTDDLFATRYFITTNGLPIKKGENYIQWNIYGPDFQFGIADNFGVGIMTSWAAIPIIANAKYSIDLGKNKSMALGMLAGTGSWAMPDFGLLLPFVSLTYGDRRNNLTLSTGYGQLFYQEDVYNYSTSISEKINRREGRYLVSIAGLAKITEKFSLVFDTFIAPWGPYLTHTEWIYEGSTYNEFTGISTDKWTPIYETKRSPSLALIIPGIRWQLDADRAFQFGFTGMYYDNEFVEFAIPMVQWYRRL